MRRIIAAAILALSFSVYGGYDVGNICVVEGGANIANGSIGAMEMIAAKEFYKLHGDLYDFIVVYSTFTPQMNMQQGLPIVDAAKGIGRDNMGIMYGPASKWGSAGKLKGGVRMCNIAQYPAEPDTLMAFPLSGMSWVELQAHEFSHFWMSAIDYKKVGDTAVNTGLRGYEDNSANQHWNYYYNSGPSVMYGSKIVDNGDGTFALSGGDRKYGELDQYVMGFRAPGEVSPFFYVCNYEPCDQGSPALPISRTASPSTLTGFKKIEVTIEDVIRAMGNRVPGSDTAQKDFNVAFVIINQPGVTPFPDQLDKLDKLRVRFEEWFKWATDGRATICTRLSGNCSGPEETNDNSDINRDADNGSGNDEAVAVSDDDIYTGEEPIEDDSDSAAAADNTAKPDNGITADNTSVNDTVQQNSDNNQVPDETGINPLDEDDSSACGCNLVY